FPAGFELIGSTLLAHVCAQLRMEGMLFLDYPQRQPTRYKHIERIKQYGSVAKNILVTFYSSDEPAGAATSCMVSEFLQQIRQISVARRDQGLFFILQLIKLVINPPPREQFLMVAHLAYLAFVKHDDLVDALDGGEAVRDDERGALGHEAVDGLLDQLLGLGVYA